MLNEVLFFLLYVLSTSIIFFLIKEAIEYHFGSYVANDMLTQVVILWISLFMLLAAFSLLGWVF